MLGIKRAYILSMSDARTFRLDAHGRSQIASMARSEVRRLRRLLTLDDARRAVDEWCHYRHEVAGVSMPSEDQRKRAALLAANEGADYARRSARLGRWA